MKNNQKKTKFNIKTLVFVIPPILIAVFPILVFYVKNFSELSIKFLPTPLIYSTLASSILTLIIFVIIRNKYKASFVSTILVFVFFSYGHLSKYLNDKLFIQLPNGMVLGPDKILLPTLFILLVFMFIKVIRSKVDFFKTISYFSIILGLLVTFNLITILVKENSRIKVENTTEENSGQINLVENTPDIYYIILDGYARQDILEKDYNYDNSKFINDLKKMGFYVNDNTRSNYVHTYLSLPSELNMRYLDDLPQKYGKAPTDKWAALNLTRINQVTKILKSSGYTTINFSSGWEGTDENFAADINYNENKNLKIAGLNIVTNETNMVFLQTTLLSPFIKEVWNDIVRMKILFALSKLPDLSYLDEKKFVTAHLVIPHPPYVFRADGSEVANPNMAMVDETFRDKTSYIEQLTYISNQIETVIKKIIKDSKNPPVIILHSDHGPASILGHPSNWKNRLDLPGGIEERTGILYAIYLPDQNYSDFENINTPINTFRILFNKYFGRNYELLPDKTYFTNYDAFYEFVDVTNE